MRGLARRRRGGGIGRLAVSAMVVGLLLPAIAFGADSSKSVAVTVSDTYDGAPFEYRIRSVERRPGYLLHRVEYASPIVTKLPQNNLIRAEYFTPDDMAAHPVKRPAVICIHILDGNTSLTRMTCVQLASRGIPAVMFLLPYYGERGPKEGILSIAREPRVFVDAVSQALHDIRRTVDLLASREEINPKCIGITGISLGGIVSATAGGMEPRLARVMPVLAGGDLNTIIHHARETRTMSEMFKRQTPEKQAELTALVRSLDPLEHAAKLRGRAAQRKVYMVNAGDDEVIPRACTEKLAEAIGISSQVHWLEGLGHYTALAALPEVLEETVAFFGEDLPPEARRPAAPPPEVSPVQGLLKTARQTLDFSFREPAAGKCHFVDLSISAALAGKGNYDGRIIAIRGVGGRFRLEAKIPMLGEVMLGQGEYPWMTSPKKVLFKGDRNAPKPPENPFRFVRSEYLGPFRMVSGLLAGAMLTPEVLDPIVTVTKSDSPNGGRLLQLSPASKKLQGNASLLYKLDGVTPERLAFQVDGLRGTVEFRQWRLDTPAVDAMFAPPTGFQEQSVDAVELHRVFSAFVNFAMERLR